MYKQGAHFGRYKGVYITDLPKSDRFQSGSPLHAPNPLRSTQRSPLSSGKQSRNFLKSCSPLRKRRNPIAEKAAWKFKTVYGQTATNLMPLF